MHLENAFNHFRDIGSVCHLTKSFRCSDHIAEHVTEFMQKYLDKNFEFHGQNYPKEEYNTTCYISRSNAALIEMIIELERIGVPYNLTRDPKYAFRLINDLASLSIESRRLITDSEYEFLNDDILEYYDSMLLQSDFNSPIAYILELYGEEDKTLYRNIKTMRSIGREKIWAAYESAKRHYKMKKKADITLSTAWSSKGLSFDTVVIMDDFNRYVNKAIENLDSGDGTEDDKEVIRLAYVALTRARYQVRDCTFWDIPRNIRIG
jgi:superfamily I DNA/RNA helicase